MKFFENLYYSIFSSSMKKLYIERDEIKLSMRVLKIELSDEQRAKLANDVFTRIEKCKSFQESKKILFFWSREMEIPTQEFILKWSETKEIFLPKINHKKLEIKKYNGVQNTTKENSFHFEPKTTPYNGSIDLAIIPGIAFDENKYRMGQGKGYYSQLIKAKKVKTIGVGFDFQIIDEIPRYWRDLKLDTVITPNKKLD